MRKSLKKVASVVLSAAMILTSINLAEVKTYAASYSVASENELRTAIFNIKVADDKWPIININADIKMSGSTNWDAVDALQSGGYDAHIVVEGNNHTISGLKSTKSGAKYAGLFGEIQGSLTVSDLTFKDCEFKADGNVGAIAANVKGEAYIKNCHLVNTKITTGNNSAGGFLGAVGILAASTNYRGAEIENCTTDANTKITVSSVGTDESGNVIAVGGIIGSMAKGSVTGCTNNAVIDGSALAYENNVIIGGVIGSSYKTVYNYVADARHNSYVLSVSECSNNGAITAVNASAVGGIVGAAKADISTVDNTAEITTGQCEATGGIIGRGEGTISTAGNEGKIETGSSANIGAAPSSNTGGIAGIFSGDIKDADNTGDITANSNAGGIAGTFGALAGKDNNNTPKPESQMSDVTNSGRVSAMSNAGGNAGVNYGKLVDVDNEGKIIGQQNIGGNVGLNKGGSVVERATNSGEIGKIPGGHDPSCVGGNIGQQEKDGKAIEVRNDGPVTGYEYVGGNIGKNDGELTNPINDGEVNGVEAVGGNVGINQIDGVITDAENNGDVTGETNVGGNVGINEGTINGGKNEGDVTGKENVGGNIGHNDVPGKGTDLSNKGDVTGEKNVGGNVGLNDGYIDGAINSGDVTGKENVDPNIGLDNGTSSNLEDLSKYEKDEDGNSIIVNIGDENGEIESLGMKFKVSPKGAGRISLAAYGKKKLTVKAKAAEGYIFKNWTATGTTVKDAKATTTTVDVAKGSVVTANFEKVKKGTVIVDEEHPVYTIGKISIASVPAKSGKVTFVREAKGTITLTAVANPGYTFDKWVVTGSAKLSSNSLAEADTVTFVYDETKDGTITAKFVKVAGPSVGKSFIYKKYTYKVTKIGSKEAEVGEVQVTGLRKKSIKTIKIAAKIKFGDVTYKVTSVKANAFKGNKKVKKAYIGKNVKTIGSNAFAKMKKLKSVVINSTKLKTIGGKAFYGDKKLKKVVIKSKKLKKIKKNAFKKTNKKLVIKVPKSKKKKYKKLVKKSGLKKAKVK